MTLAYAELHCISNFSFLRGASHPDELVHQAAKQGYRALALTDECSFAGIVRAHREAKERGFKLIIGSEIQLADGPKLVLLARNKAGYEQLCRLITHGRRQSEKGHYRLVRADLNAGLSDCLCLLLPEPHHGTEISEISEYAAWVSTQFATRSWLVYERHRQPDDDTRLYHLQQLGTQHGLPLVACGDVHMHQRERQVLQDTLTAIRHGCTLDKAGLRLFPNGERYLRSLPRLRALYPPELLAESVRIAALCNFSLDELNYQYPAENLPPNSDANSHLRQQVLAGLQQHWPRSRHPQGAPFKVRRLIAKELRLIRQLNYPHYFLTVYDIVLWARSQGILCQGRGSAANSAVCFVLGITVVNPDTSSPLFERFISAERGEPPDIDVDFEHTRREEVFQYIYRKYSRHHAALAATVIRYKSKSALRDVGKALGLSVEDVNRISQSLAWWDQAEELPERLRTLGFDPDAPLIRQLLHLTHALRHFPRHLSQHVGGFVITAQPLDTLVPVENAAMANRTVIQWDKDDLDTVGLFKIDCLALGMLTAIHKAFDLVAGYSGRHLSIPFIRAKADSGSAETRAVFRMLSRAQSIGVFQVESRAQMSMLPRMQPRCLYDLTVETAIVRPGPIQGGMVHPYINRRMGREAVHCPAGLEDILGRTYGIPIFQEQVMEICIKGAGFPAGEADQVRRSMAAWGRSGYGKLERFEKRLKDGFRRNGYSDAFARTIFEQIKGFAEYGFPESHAASFAVLVYVSAWLKLYEPAAFLAGLLNAQPMGFYSPSQLIQEFRRNHTVKVWPVDVLHSAWESQLEFPDAAVKNANRPGVRLGLNRIKGLSDEGGRRVADWALRALASTSATPPTAERFFHAVSLSEKDRHALAAADALRSLTGDRHQAHWREQGLKPASGPLYQQGQLDDPPDNTTLPPSSEGENLVADYASLGFTLRRHPLALLRTPHLQALRTLTSRQWRQLANGCHCRIAGMVTNRQRPGTAKGLIFMTLEDETGHANLVIRPDILQRYRQEVLQSPLVIAEGINEYRDGVRHLLVRSLEDHSHLLGRLEFQSRDFH